jgi:hypothetical protein
MKHLILFTILIAAIFVGLGVAVSTHNGSVHQLSLQTAKQAALHVREAAKVQAEAQSTAKKLQAANATINLLLAQCKTGQANYNLLATLQKQHAQVLYCNYSQVQ